MFFTVVFFSYSVYEQIFNCEFHRVKALEISELVGSKLHIVPTKSVHYNCLINVE